MNVFLRGADCLLKSLRGIISQSLSEHSVFASNWVIIKSNYVYDYYYITKCYEMI